MTEPSSNRTHRRNDSIINLTGYKTDFSLSKPQRLAHLLDWCAKKYPRQALPLNIALKGIEGYSRTPRMDSQEVQQLKSKVQRSKRILLEKYSRTLVSEKGIGIWATVDHDDHVEKGVIKAAERLTSAKKSLQAIVDIVDPTKIKRRDLKSFLGNVNGVLRAAKEADFNAKLLPPGKEAEED